MTARWHETNRPDTNKNPRGKRVTRIVTDRGTFTPKEWKDYLKAMKKQDKDRKK